MRPVERGAMRWSRAFLPVLKESPADAQIVSHKLMLRAGLVRQTAAGIAHAISFCAALSSAAEVSPRSP